MLYTLRSVQYGDHSQTLLIQAWILASVIATTVSCQFTTRECLGKSQDTESLEPNLVANLLN